MQKNVPDFIYRQKGNIDEIRELLLDIEAITRQLKTNLRKNPKIEVDQFWVEARLGWLQDAKDYLAHELPELLGVHVIPKEYFESQEYREFIENHPIAQEGRIKPKAGRKTKKELVEQISQMVYFTDVEEIVNSHTHQLEIFMNGLKFLQDKLNPLDPNTKYLGYIIKEMATRIQMQKIVRGDFTEGVRPLDLSVDDLWKLAEIDAHDKNQIN